MFRHRGDDKNLYDDISFRRDVSKAYLLRDGVKTSNKPT